MMTDHKTVAVTQYHRKLQLFINNKVSNLDDAEDILADVYVRYLARSTAPENPLAWLYTVTKNSIIDYYRSQRLHEPLPEDIKEETLESDQFKEFSACILPMLENMDNKERHVIQMIDIDGYKQQQAAQKLNLSLPALKSRLLRARSKLHNMMVQCCPPVLNKKGKVEEFNSPSKTCLKC